MNRVFKLCVVSSFNDPINSNFPDDDFYFQKKLESVGSRVFFAICPIFKDLITFKEQIHLRLPETKNKPMKLYYEDYDCDYIRIENDADFDIFLESKETKVFILMVPPSVNGGSKPNSVNNRFSSNGTTPASTEMPNVYFPISGPKKADQSTATVNSKLVNDPAAKSPLASNLKVLGVKASDINSIAARQSTQNRIFHPYIICDGCDKTISGNRYKCLECDDFDLCMDCEWDLKHPDHLMFRVANPIDSDLCKHVHATFRKIISDVILKKISNGVFNAEKKDAQKKAGVISSTAENMDLIEATIERLAPSHFKFREDETRAAEAKVHKNWQKSILPSWKVLANQGFDITQTLKNADNSTTNNLNQSTAAKIGNANIDELMNATAIDIHSPSKPTEPETVNEEGKTAQNEQKEKPTEENAVLPVKQQSPKHDKRAELIKEFPPTSPFREWTLVNASEADIHSKNFTPTVNKDATPVIRMPSPQLDVEKEKICAISEAKNDAKSDYQELTRLLSLRLSSMQIPTVSVPSTPAAPKASVISRSDKDKRIEEALTTMLEMGFNNKGSWLTQMLESVDGDVNRALRILRPEE